MAGITKVAHVVRRFAPDKWGGTESVVFNLARELEGRGVESPVFCTSMFSTPGVQRMQGVTVRRYSCLLPWFGLSDADKAALRLKGGSPLSLPLFFGLLREKNLSVIHAHVGHRLGGMARTVARLRGIPYVVSLHGGHFTLPADQVERLRAPFRGKPEWGKAFGWLFGARRVLADADAIICVGADEYEEVRRQMPAKRVVLVPNGVQVRRFAEADASLFRRAYGFGPDDRIVLCVSRIDYQKNQLGLVRAFAAFAETHPDHRLALVGPVADEAYHRQVQAEIQTLGLGGRVRIVAGLRPDDPLLPSAYRAAELFVLPSRYEPFGIVVLEAWAAGTPVVAARVGGIPGFATDRENILLAEDGDERRLAERMAELAGNPELRNRLAANGAREVAAKYDWPAVADQILEVYGQVRGR